jgi:hypothetical protein
MGAAQFRSLVKFSRTFIPTALLLARSAHGQQQKDPRAVQPERPTVATHAFTVAPGYVEIETGVERDQFNPDIHSALIPTIVKIGLSSRAQLSILVPVVRPVGATFGIGDALVGVKYRFTDDAPIVGAFALLPAVKAPTGSADLERGTNTTDFSLLAISSHMLGDVAVDINVGYTRRSGDGSNAPTNATQWTLSTGGPFTGAFGWVAEVFGFPGTSGQSGQAPSVGFLVGPTFLAATWLQFDAGMIIPVHGPQPHALYAGAVYNVGGLFRGRR